MVSDMLGGVSELLERLIENALIVLRNVEFELDVPNNLHTSSVMVEVFKTPCADRGVRLAIGGVCEGLCLLPPTTEVVGFRLGSL